MSTAQELRAKAAHYRKLAPMMDEEVARLCRSLAAQYDEEAAATSDDKPEPIISVPEPG